MAPRRASRFCSTPPESLRTKSARSRIARPCAWLTAAVRYSGPRCLARVPPGEQRQWTARTKLSAAAEREGHHVAPARKQGRREAWTAARGIRRVRVRRWLPESRPRQRDVGELGEARPVPGPDRQNRCRSGRADKDSLLSCWSFRDHRDRRRVRGVRCSKCRRLLSGRPEIASLVMVVSSQRIAVSRHSAEPS